MNWLNKNQNPKCFLSHSPFLFVFISFWFRHDQLAVSSPLDGLLDVDLSHVDNSKLFNLFFTDFTYTLEVWGIRKAWRFRSCAMITMKLDLFASYLSKEKLMKWGKSTGPSSLCGFLEPPLPCAQSFTWVRSAPGPSPRWQHLLHCMSHLQLH